MPEIIVPIKVYAKVLFALLALTATTCAVSFIDMGKMNAVVAVVIAFVKASLVALIFMHLRYSRRLMKVVVGAGLFWLGILIALTMSDFLTRGWQ
ncbi:MAG TPA: cytochrome C oxidase subunit IV family protein [Blastocatellia bacterium]|jgi:cytochrome c oxidase subunit 4|nr:cytochrome C oxidase subunit IV family protein [Blastocatellia bacterium]